MTGLDSEPVREPGTTTEGSTKALHGLILSEQKTPSNARRREAIHKGRGNQLGRGWGIPTLRCRSVFLAPACYSFPSDSQWEVVHSTGVS
jgi:hypothetical protein